ncbi:hypothetical protein B0H17DRAFT_1198183 [Mycena rosella]|uniref:Uncharacterized protein n=1 Tax=Mycena rosella TaxID=1033263 RepID=A0AAD7DPS6_MYCRO|nr:hypothetical protein B0H17DRAFT_1198183 [Mycena rosella]
MTSGTPLLWRGLPARYRPSRHLNPVLSAPRGEPQVIDIEGDDAPTATSPATAHPSSSLHTPSSDTGPTPYANLTAFLTVPASAGAAGSTHSTPTSGSILIAARGGGWRMQRSIQTWQHAHVGVRPQCAWRAANSACTTVFLARARHRRQLFLMREWAASAFRREEQAGGNQEAAPKGELRSREAWSARK